MTLRPTALQASMSTTVCRLPSAGHRMRAPRAGHCSTRTAAGMAAPRAVQQPDACTAALAPQPPKLLPKALDAAFSAHARVGADFIGAAMWEGQSLDVLCDHLDAAQRKLLHKEVLQQKFTGRRGQRALVPLMHHDRLIRVMLVGLGRPDASAAFDAGKALVQHSVRHGAQNAVVVPPETRPETAAEDVVTHLVRGLHLGTYRYDACKSAPATALPRRLAVAAPRTGSWLEAAERGLVLAESAALARDLVNTPPNMLTPEAFADIAQAQAQRHGLGCQVYDLPALRANRMNLIEAVGKSSKNPPRLVHLTYRPDGDQDRPRVTLVGKGITFDSGGLCIKPAGAMLGMKADMGGAAAVLGAILGVARLQGPVAVDAVLALAENSIGEDAYRPGDVYVSAAGKTVEIINTDAEGRLVLADALHLARLRGTAATEIVDVATLTGACVSALGGATAGLFSNDATLADELQAAAAAVGESVWPLPLSAALEPELRSFVADLKNCGSGKGGAITAALFLREFVGDARWAHLDIAGPATGEEGATGFAAATLAEYVLRKTLIA